MHVISQSVVITNLNTRVAHNGTQADISRAIREAQAIDKQKTVAANERARVAGHDGILSHEQIRTGSWARENLSVRCRMALEAAQSDPARAVVSIKTAIEGAKARLAGNLYRDDAARRDIETLERMLPDFEDRARAETKAEVESKSESPTWIDARRQEIEGDYSLSPAMKRKRLAMLQQSEERITAEMEAEAERRSRFDRSEVTAAIADATLSVRIAELSTALPEEFVISARQRLENLKNTGDETRYHAETAIAEARQSEFLAEKKAEKKAAADAEAQAARAAAGKPEPLPAAPNIEPVAPAPKAPSFL